MSRGETVLLLAVLAWLPVILLVHLNRGADWYGAGRVVGRFIRMMVVGQ